MEFSLKYRCSLPIPALALLFMAMSPRVSHGQAPVVGVAGNKLREAMSQQDPAQKLRLFREAEPLFSDPVSKYSVLYPNLIDAYLGVDDLSDAAKAVDEMAKASVPAVTESDSRLRLATAFLNKKQYDSAMQQLNSTVALLKSDAKAAPTSKIQQSLVTALAIQGEALVEMGFAQKALAALQESEELRRSRHLDPSASTARNIARCYAALGKEGDALESFGEAYSLAAHRVSATQKHIDVVGPTASAGFTQELTEQQTLVTRIREEARPVYGSRDGQTPFGKFLNEKLDAFDKALIADAMNKAKSNKPAPDFSLTSVSGSKTKLSELRGKVVLLNFWDTTCKPCRAEYPHLQKIQDEFKNQGLTVLMINLDEDTTKVRPFAEKYGFAARVLLKDDTIQRAYGIGAIPHTVIVDGSGTIRFNEVGFTLDTPEVFRAEVRSLLPKAQ
ncbi:peroxiredoxin [Edaphobacter aggregans]|uniref:Peroxiredoxin n=1 Tax=Edaphobacter aggregans TaxID=570835 RepID=A0A428MGF7_9BACT|nr:redoxin domain-containing protein [Edaphobacter aggregans]RSL15783.1 peroxiredoxin [Edaphobacter aggregans]